MIDEVLADNKASNHGRQHAQDPQHHSGKREGTNDDQRVS
jgi:hypothetical protein